MSMMRIVVTDSGIMLTLVRMRSSSATATERSRNDTSIGRAAAISAFTAASIVSLNPSGNGSNSKSIRPDSGSMFPPVTALPYSFQITPHNRCIAV